MTARRLAAMGLAALMLNVNLARADAACATHDVETPQASGQQHASGQPQVSGEQRAHGEHHAAENVPAPEKGSCDAPAQQDCCQALASCSVLLGVDASVQDDVDFRYGSVAVAMKAAPLTRARAPEPPPPKA